MVAYGGLTCISCAMKCTYSTINKLLNLDWTRAVQLIPNCTLLHIVLLVSMASKTDMSHLRFSEIADPRSSEGLYS